MSTKSNKSSGTQHTQRGVNQGNVIVGPKSGLPIDEIVDGNGKRRLAVDAALTLDTVTVETDDLTAIDDAVRLEDPDTGAHVRVEANGSLNANVEVDAADGDNIAVHDSDGNELKINPDGSINTNIVVTTGTILSFFNEISSVASGINTPILTYTVPLGKTDLLEQIEVSGTNIAAYEVYLNSTIFARKRTYFGSSLNELFTFSGYKLLAGDTVVVKVLHNRPDVGDFESRIQVIES